MACVMRVAGKAVATACTCVCARARVHVPEHVWEGVQGEDGRY